MQYDNYIAPPTHPSIYKTTTDHDVKKFPVLSPTAPKRAQHKKLQKFNVNNISKTKLDAILKPYISNKMAPIFSSTTIKTNKITEKIRNLGRSLGRKIDRQIGRKIGQSICREIGQKIGWKLGSHGPW